MIYLIGGVSKSGKTYIARKIMEEKKIPFLSTDVLMWALGDYKDNGLFSYFDNDKKVSEIIKPYLLKVIGFIVKSNKDYVIEGTHITTDLVKELNDRYKDTFKSIFLGYRNASVASKVNEILNHENESDNLWYKALDKNEFDSFIDKAINYSKEIEDLCTKNNLKYFDVSNIENEYKYIKNILEIK